MNANRLLKISQKDLPNTYIMLGGRGSGRTFAYYWRLFRKQYARERKKLMGELIILLSIVLILTVLSSFWIGYSYGKLRTIKSYEESQIQTIKDCLNSVYGTTGKGTEDSEDE